MRDFFHGWRRKAGIVSLLPALLLMGGWIRSDYIADFIIWAAFKNRTETLFSAENKLTWQTHHHSSEITDYPRWTTSVLDQSIASDGEDPDNQYTTWRFRFLGFEAGELDFPIAPGEKFSFCSIPYWFMVIPLTLLSASLVLWTPQERHRITTNLGGDELD
jgi:hypothetical protein